jgi:hypothetical protein
MDTKDFHWWSDFIQTMKQKAKHHKIKVVEVNPRQCKWCSYDPTNDMQGAMNVLKKAKERN